VRDTETRDATSEELKVLPDPNNYTKSHKIVLRNLDTGVDTVFEKTQYANFRGSKIVNTWFEWRARVWRECDG
jgi:hypothetical protein